LFRSGKRTWARLIVTAAAIAVGVFLYEAYDVTEAECGALVCGPSGTFYLYVADFFGWLLALSLIWFVVWLVDEELPHRREIRAAAQGHKR
jgi:hypothetical protein